MNTVNSRFVSIDDSVLVVWYLRYIQQSQTENKLRPLGSYLFVLDMYIYKTAVFKPFPFSLIVQSPVQNAKRKSKNLLTYFFFKNHFNLGHGINFQWKAWPLTSFWVLHEPLSLPLWPPLPTATTIHVLVPCLHSQVTVLGPKLRQYAVIFWISETPSVTTFLWSHRALLHHLQCISSYFDLVYILLWCIVTPLLSLLFQILYNMHPFLFSVEICSFWE